VITVTEQERMTSLRMTSLAGVVTYSWAGEVRAAMAISREQAIAAAAREVYGEGGLPAHLSVGAARLSAPLRAGYTPALSDFGRMDDGPYWWVQWSPR